MSASHSTLDKKGKKGPRLEVKGKPAVWVTPAFSFFFGCFFVTDSKTVLQRRSLNPPFIWHQIYAAHSPWTSACMINLHKRFQCKAKGGKSNWVTSGGAICSLFDCLTGGPLLMGLHWSKCKRGGEWWCCLKSRKLNCWRGSDGKIRDCQDWIPVTLQRSWLGNLALGFYM